MKITFDPTFDHGYWPGPLADKEAVSGEIWVGPSGLLGLLETMTGLSGPPVPSALRAAELVPAIRGTSGFWSDSAQVDPFGTAKRVLQWRDTLRMHGWRFQPVSPRLAQLAEVTEKTVPGFPDRVLQVAETFMEQSNAVSQLILMAPYDQLPFVWKTALDALQKTGTELIQKTLKPVKSRGDLAACKKASFKPKGDGSLQFLRTDTTGAAAHETAAWLSTLNGLEQTVIIGADSILDQALHRFGIPTTGAVIPVSDNGLLQILPLTLTMGWNPPNPQRALELLTLPISPVPRGIARRLSDAIQDYPAVGSDAWHKALEEGLEKIDDNAARKRLKKRIMTLFRAGSTGSQYPVTEIISRIDLLRSWAKGRMPEEDPGPGWHALLSQLENCRRIVELSALEDFTAPQIRRMLYDITEESGSAPLRDAQAGVSTVGAPEGVAGKARSVIWWSFNKNAAPIIPVDPLTISERKGLIKEGVQLPEPGDEALWAAQRWKRPLDCAAENLILVCARQGIDGEPQYPHPLWDELVGKVKDDTALKQLVREALVSKPRPTRRTRKPRPLPEPVLNWHVRPKLMVKRPKESPNSLASLISCPFKWVVQYLGNVWGGKTATLDTPETLEGWLIHEILLRVLQQPVKKPETAVKKAMDIFDKEGPRLAALFFQPGFDDIRAAAKQAVHTATEELFRMLGKGGFTRWIPEESRNLKVRSLGIEIEGRPDLVLEKPDAVIDFKRGGVTYRQGELTNGVGLQLAVYGHLVRKREAAPFPPVAYLMLKAGQVITVDSKTFPNARFLEGPGPEETWNGVKKSFKKIWSDLAAGTVNAPGNDPEGAPESTLTDDQLFLEPCKFCNLAVLCGQAFGEAS